MCIRNTVSDEIASYLYLQFFPSIGSIIAERLFSRDQLDEIFESAGFELAAHQSSASEIAPNWDAFAKKIGLKADSFVASLDDDEFQSGLRSLQAHAKSAPAGDSVSVNVDALIYRKT